MLILSWSTSNLFFLTSLHYQLFTSVQGEVIFLLCYVVNIIHKKCGKKKKEKEEK